MILRAAIAALVLCGGAAVARVASSPPVEMRYLYGSAEAAAVSAQTYAAIVAHAKANRPHPSSVVLAADATLAQPRFDDCRDKPLAAVFDMDETAVLNLGFEYDVASSGEPWSEPRWDRWERTGAQAVAPVPGAVAAFAALRELGVTPIINSNRAAANAANAEAALVAAGLGAFHHGDTLYLHGDVDGSDKKDSRRREIAARYCVVALVGDQLGDISDLFAGDPPARRAAAQTATIDAMWGRGWFVLPNPVYGSGIKGNWGEIFPEDKRWADPAREGGK